MYTHIKHTHSLKHWAGEAMTAWMHIKVIRTFVEAVLRYGLPVDYTTVITR